MRTRTVGFYPSFKILRNLHDEVLLPRQLKAKWAKAISMKWFDSKPWKVNFIKKYILPVFFHLIRLVDTQDDQVVLHNCILLAVQLRLILGLPDDNRGRYTVNWWEFKNGSMASFYLKDERSIIILRQFSNMVKIQLQIE